MTKITTTHVIKWRVSFAEHIGFTAKGEFFNLKTSRQLKRSYRGKNKGYFIGEFFYALEDLRHFLKRDANKKADYPF